jgi:hypothetical protein
MNYALRRKMMTRIDNDLLESEQSTSTSASGASDSLEENHDLAIGGPSLLFRIAVGWFGLIFVLQVIALLFPFSFGIPTIDAREVYIGASRSQFLIICNNFVIGAGTRTAHFVDVDDPDLRDLPIGDGWQHRSDTPRSPEISFLGIEIKWGKDFVPVMGHIKGSHYTGSFVVQETRAIGILYVWLLIPPLLIIVPRLTSRRDSGVSFTRLSLYQTDDTSKPNDRG